MSMLNNAIIDARSMAQVQVKLNLAVIEDGKAWVVEPSAILFSKKGVSLGHSLITNLDGVFLTNLTNQTQFIPKVTCLARLEAVENSGLDINNLSETEIDTDAISIEDKLQTRINQTLPTEDKKELSDLLYRQKDCFALSKRDLGQSTVLQHQILTGVANLISQAPYRSAFKQREKIQTQVSEMLQDGIIEPSGSPWASPVVLVKKKDGSWRFCVDFRKMNLLTEKDVYPLPRIDDALSRLDGARYFSIMDMRSGFWQGQMHPDST